MDGLDAIVLPGGESTAMGLIGTSTKDGEKTMWECLQEFSREKPTWGTCAGMILLSEKCVGTSAVIEDGQALIGGVDITVCRNYFGSQVSSFEMPTPPPPTAANQEPFPGVFIRAPAILSAGPNVEVLGRVVATPCRQAAATLNELERKIEAGEEVIKMHIADSRSLAQVTSSTTAISEGSIVLPGAAEGTGSREVICAARKGNLLVTAFHPEITSDYRWHEYFLQMVVEASQPTES